MKVSASTALVFVSKLTPSDMIINDLDFTPSGKEISGSFQFIELQDVPQNLDQKDSSWQVW